MYEKCASFNDYIRELGIERIEGVLMRYLSQVWKTLEQTVPLSARTEELLDVLAYLGTMLRDVDTSLLEEWEALADPSITAIRLTGRGPSFCSGGDLDEFGTTPDVAAAHLIRLDRQARARPAVLLAALQVVGQPAVGIRQHLGTRHRVAERRQYA